VDCLIMKTGTVVSLNVGNYDYVLYLSTRQYILEDFINLNLVIYRYVYIPSVMSRNHFYYVISLFC